MMSNKFAIGDEVVLIKLCSLTDYEDFMPIGSEAVVEDITGGTHCIVFRFKNPNITDYFTEDKLELLSIYNSPLYRALR